MILLHPRYKTFTGYKVHTYKKVYTIRYILGWGLGTQNSGTQGEYPDLNQILGMGWVGFVYEFHGYFRVGFP